MDDLIIKWLRGRATPEDQRKLDAWRRADPANERRARELEQVWSLAGEVEPPRIERRVLPLRQRPDRAPAAGPGRRRSPRRPFWAAAAAAAIAAVAAVWMLQPFGGDKVQPAVQVTEVRTGADEMTTIHLRDGTAVRLAPQSRLRLAGEGTDQVRVWLEGRAFFGVPSRDGRPPFVVHTHTGDAHVLGTRFDVKADVEDLQIVVLDGLVAVSTPVGSIEVGPGQLSSARQGEHPVLESVDDVHAVTDWMGRSMIFQDNMLTQVVNEIERRHGRQVRIETPELGQQTVTATFTEESFEEVVNVLCRLLGATCSVTAGSAVIAAL